MIPETNRMRTIELYKSDDTPAKWIKVKNLMDNVIASDTIVFFSNHIWWMFTTIKDNNLTLTATNNLHIFYTTDLLEGKWVSHCENPVLTNCLTARSAGSVFIRKGKMIRPSQNAYPHYGYSVVLNEITELSIQHYAEVKITELLPDNPRQIGIHSYNSSDSYLVTDSLVRRRKWFVKANGKTVLGKQVYAAFPPPTDKSNPFQILLSNHLKQKGWDYSSFNLSFKKLWQNRNNVSVLYFHWPESIWRKSLFFKMALAAGSFIVKLYFAKTLGYKLAWSAHNVIPHTYKSLTLERFMRKWILKNFDLIIGHAYDVDKALSERFSIKFDHKYTLALHGIYEDHYRPSDKLKRENFNISQEAKLLLLMSNGKPYQGNESFIEFWLNHCHDSSIHLIVTGKFSESLLRKIAKCASITLVEGFLPDQTMADLMVMTDFVVLPYERITTSGMYFLALTFEKPIIAPNIRFFERHTLPTTAILFDANKHDYQSAIDIVKSGWQKDEIAIRKLKEKFSWNDSAEFIAEAFNNLILN